jgi:hypothetical protein
MNKTYSREELAQMLKRTIPAISLRRFYLRHGYRPGRKPKAVSRYHYSDPLDALLEPALPSHAYEAAERWWHTQSPDAIYDRDQAHLAFLWGYAKALDVRYLSRRNHAKGASNE